MERPICSRHINQAQDTVKSCKCLTAAKGALTVNRRDDGRPDSNSGSSTYSALGAAQMPSLTSRGPLRARSGQLVCGLDLLSFESGVQCRDVEPWQFDLCDLDANAVGNKEVSEFAAADEFDLIAVRPAGFGDGSAGEMSSRDDDAVGSGRDAPAELRDDARADSAGSPFCLDG